MVRAPRWMVLLAALVLVAVPRSGQAQATHLVPRADWGDAPAPYPTLSASQGARHVLEPGFSLGNTVDAEDNGRPTILADGDDLNPATIDDEDGVSFPILIPGSTATLEITVKDTLATGARRVDVYIDLNRDGLWNVSTERFVLAGPVIGLNFLAIPVPETAVPGATYARVRLSRNGTTAASGSIPNGEVEDYRVQIADYDFGDAWEGGDLVGIGYPTRLARNGARHRIVSGFFLGARVDRESDGQPHPDAVGDDLNPTTADDEDGVELPATFTAGATAELRVTASGAGFLDAWMDFNRNGSWADPGEKVFGGVSLTPGANVLVAAIPAGAAVGRTFARFRFSREGVAAPDGEALSGEVEDYTMEIVPPLLDFGDALATIDLGAGSLPAYPTLLSQNGARHPILPGFHLGAAIDGEVNGQPNLTATGDDQSPPGSPDDEDGVRFLGDLIPGEIVDVEITSSGSGRVDAWIDFNRNLSWSDPLDQVLASVAVSPGINTFSILVPGGVDPGATYARFRLSQEGGLAPTGLGGPGEVEDYGLDIHPEPERGCDGECGGSEFWLTFPGNYAPDPANPVEPTLLIVGTPDTTGTISISGLGYVHPFAIPASGSLKVILPAGADLSDANDFEGDNGIRDRGIRVTTAGNAKISVYALSRVRQTSDGYHALPKDVLGTDYVVAGYGNVHTGIPPLNGSQFAVVAASSGATTVTITPSTETGAHDAGVPYTVTLSQGQVYQLRNTFPAPSDLTGTLVQADQPIAVFGSHRCANVRSVDAFYCDYLVEQLVPVPRWGFEHFTHPLRGRSGGDTVRVLAAEDGTVVAIDGVIVATLARGKFHEALLSAPAFIAASKRVHVSQYANSSDHDGVVKADPFMVQIPHRKQFSAQHRFVAAQDDAGDEWLDDFLDNSVNIIAPSNVAAANEVLLDGVPVLASSFTPIGASGFSGASVALPGWVTVHTVTATKPVGVIAYGFAAYDSYAWPVCPNFGDTQAPQVLCPAPQSVTLGANISGGEHSCQAPVPDFRRGAVVRDECDPNLDPVPTQVPAPGTLVGPGVHEVVLTATDASGNVGRCTTTFTVIDPNSTAIPSFTVCPPEIVRAACTGPGGAVVHFDVAAMAGCTPVEVECVPPSGSMFPIGRTPVMCRLKGYPLLDLVCTFTVSVDCDLIGIQRTGARVDVVWTPGGVLQFSESPAGPWKDVPASADGRAIISIREPQKFYRLRK